MPSVVMNRIRASSMRHEHTVLVGQSPFSGKVQQSDQLDWRWVGKFEYRSMTRAEASPLLAEIKASVATKAPLYVYDPDFKSPLSGITTIAYVNGAGQTGTTIALGGLPNSMLVAKAGDKFYVPNVGLYTTGQMFEVLADATTNGTGFVSILIDCPYRGTLLNTQSVLFAATGNGSGYAPVIPVRVVSWDEGMTDKQGRSVVTLSFEEIV